MQRRNMQQHDPQRRLPELLAGDDSLQPVGLGLPVTVEIGQPPILDIVIGLILAAVQHHEKCRPVAERIVEPPGRRRKIVRSAVGKSAPVFVIAPYETERHIGCEEFRGRSQIAVEQLPFGFDHRRHVAVQHHEIGIFLRHAAQQLTEQRIVAVDVVHDGETDRLLVGIQRGHIIGFVFVDPAGCDPARNHALVATVFENSLREDAVTVTGSRLKSRDRDPVQTADDAFAVFRMIVTRPLRRIEIAAVVRRDLHPSHSIGVGGPDDREPGFGDGLQIRPRLDFNSRQRRLKQSRTEQEKIGQNTLFHRLLIFSSLLCSESAFAGYRPARLCRSPTSSRRL